MSSFKFNPSGFNRGNNNYHSYRSLSGESKYANQNFSSIQNPNQGYISGKFNGVQKESSNIKEIFQKVSKDISNLEEKIEETFEIESKVSELRLKRASLEASLSQSKLKEAELNSSQGQNQKLNFQIQSLENEIAESLRIFKDLEVKLVEVSEFEGKNQSLSKMKETLLSTNSQINQDCYVLQSSISPNNPFTAQIYHLKNQVKLKEIEKTQKSAALAMIQTENTNLFGALENLKSQASMIEQSLTNSASPSSIEKLKAENYGLEAKLASIYKEIHQMKSNGASSAKIQFSPSKLENENNELKEQIKQIDLDIQLLDEENLEVLKEYNAKFEEMTKENEEFCVELENLDEQISKLKEE